MATTVENSFVINLTKDLVKEPNGLIVKCPFDLQTLSKDKTYLFNDINLFNKTETELEPTQFNVDASRTKDHTISFNSDDTSVYTEVKDFNKINKNPPVISNFSDINSTNSMKAGSKFANSRNINQLNPTSKTTSTCSTNITSLNSGNIGAISSTSSSLSSLPSANTIKTIISGITSNNTSRSVVTESVNNPTKSSKHFPEAILPSKTETENLSQMSPTSATSCSKAAEMGNFSTTRSALQPPPLPPRIGNKFTKATTDGKIVHNEIIPNLHPGPYKPVPTPKAFGSGGTPCVQGSHPISSLHQLHPYIEGGRNGSISIQTSKCSQDPYITQSPKFLVADNSDNILKMFKEMNITSKQGSLAQNKYGDVKEPNEDSPNHYAPMRAYDPSKYPIVSQSNYRAFPANQNSNKSNSNQGQLPNGVIHSSLANNSTISNVYQTYNGCVNSKPSIHAANLSLNAGSFPSTSQNYSTSVPSNNYSYHGNVNGGNIPQSHASLSQNNGNNYVISAVSNTATNSTSTLVRSSMLNSSMRQDRNWNQKPRPNSVRFNVPPTSPTLGTRKLENNCPYYPDQNQSWNGMHHSSPKKTDDSRQCDTFKSKQYRHPSTLDRDILNANNDSVAYSTMNGHVKRENQSYQSAIDRLSNNQASIYDNERLSLDDQDISEDMKKNEKWGSLKRAGKKCSALKNILSTKFSKSESRLNQTGLNGECIFDGPKPEENVSPNQSTECAVRQNENNIQKSFSFTKEKSHNFLHSRNESSNGRQNITNSSKHLNNIQPSASTEYPPYAYGNATALQDVQNAYQLLKRTGSLGHLGVAISKHSPQTQTSQQPPAMGVLRHSDDNILRPLASDQSYPEYTKVQTKEGASVRFQSSVDERTSGGSDSGRGTGGGSATEHKTHDTSLESRNSNRNQGHCQSSGNESEWIDISESNEHPLPAPVPNFTGTTPKYPEGTKTPPLPPLSPYTFTRKDNKCNTPQKKQSNSFKSKNYGRSTHSNAKEQLKSEACWSYEKQNRFPLTREYPSTGCEASLDLGSVFDDVTEVTTDDDLASAKDDDAYLIRRQLEGLEGMYSEVLKALGGKSRGTRPVDPRFSRRRNRGSISSLPSSVVSGRAARDHRKNRLIDERLRRPLRDNSKNTQKRFVRLENHVVTLARSVAQLSSEMRNQQLMAQEFETIRSDMANLKISLKVPSKSQSRGLAERLGERAAAGYFGQNQEKIKKLTNFFGDEPPLVRIFLRRLGYEKYANIFEQEKIGMLELPYMTEDRLQKLGIPLGPRLRILEESRGPITTDGNLSVYVV